MDEFATTAVEGFDDIVGNTLNPTSCLNTPTPNQKVGEANESIPVIPGNSDQQDPDKIFRTNPGFDPVFMKV